MKFTLVTKNDKFSYIVVDTKTYKGFELRQCKRKGSDDSDRCRWWKAFRGDQELSKGGRNLSDMKNVITIYLKSSS